MASLNDPWVARSPAMPRRREEIATPALLCDVDILDANIARMAQRARVAGVALRPHVKSHKSAFVAARQLAAGAVGLSCAKLSEASAVVTALRATSPALAPSLLITSPLADARSAERAAALAAHCTLAVVVDHLDAVWELANAVRATGTALTVLGDVDVGLGRTGVATTDDALDIARLVSSQEGLRWGGVQGYGGHLQHIEGRAARREATSASMARLTAVIDVLAAEGFATAWRTGGGTGTAGIDAELGVLNEWQPGSYVFMDREYRDAMADDVEGEYGQSLTIATTVVSVNQLGYVTVDAGLKSMATDAGVARVVGESNATYQFFGDEHGMIISPHAHSWRRGHRFELVPPHCDPTVDRYDVVWLVRGDDVLGTTTVDARGCSQ